MTVPMGWFITEGIRMNAELEALDRATPPIPAEEHPEQEVAI